MIENIDKITSLKKLKELCHFNSYHGAGCMNCDVFELCQRIKPGEKISDTSEVLKELFQVIQKLNRKEKLKKLLS